MAALQNGTCDLGRSAVTQVQRRQISDWRSREEGQLEAAPRFQNPKAWSARLITGDDATDSVDQPGTMGNTGDGR